MKVISLIASIIVGVFYFPALLFDFIRYIYDPKAYTSGDII